MKSILLSIQPQLVAEILNGRKKLEVRKTMPKCELPIDVHIYVTKGKPYLTYCGIGLNDNSYQWRAVKQKHCDRRYSSSEDFNGKVIAKFTLNKIEDIESASCCKTNELEQYLGREQNGDASGYAWHIDDLIICYKSKGLEDFNLRRAPQSWCYVEENK